MKHAFTSTVRRNAFRLIAGLMLVGAVGLLLLVMVADFVPEAAGVVLPLARLPGFVGSLITGGLVAGALIPVRRTLKRWYSSRNAPDSARPASS